MFFDVQCLSQITRENKSPPHFGSICFFLRTSRILFFKKIGEYLIAADCSSWRVDLLCYFSIDNSTFDKRFTFFINLKAIEERISLTVQTDVPEHHLRIFINCTILAIPNLECVYVFHYDKKTLSSLRIFNMNSLPFRGTNNLVKNT